MGLKDDKDKNPPGEDDKDKNPPGDGDDPKDKDDADDLDGDGGADLSPEEAKAAIAKLRKENAAARVKNKDLMSKFSTMEERFSKLEKGIKTAVGIEDKEEVDPEKLKVKLQEKDTKIVQLEGQMALLNAADEHGIPPAGRKYFAMLINEAATELEEEEDLSEEKLAEIVKEVKTRFGKSGDTSVDGKSGDTPPPDNGGKGKVTVEDFARMNTTEKSVLYQKQPDLYNSLFKQAKEKRLLI